MMRHHAGPPRWVRREVHAGVPVTANATADVDGRCYLLLAVRGAKRVHTLIVDDELVEDLSDALAEVKSRRDPGQALAT